MTADQSVTEARIRRVQQREASYVDAVALLREIDTEAVALDIPTGIAWHGSSATFYVWACAAEGGSIVRDAGDSWRGQKELRSYWTDHGWPVVRRSSAS